MKTLIPDFKKALKTIDESNHVVLLSHRHPDADTIGASLAMSHVLKNQHSCSITCVCADPLPESLIFLKKEYIIRKKLSKKCDCIVALDCSTPEQTKFPTITKEDIPLINIDHHTTNTHYGDINIIDPHAASATEMLYHFFKETNLSYNDHIATCLLAGMYNDTGSFMHSNTTKETLKTAGELQKKGADLQRIVKKLFNTHSIEQLRLWGKVLSNVRINDKGTLVSKISTKELEETNASSRELAGVINYLNCIPEARITILLSEDSRGNIQGSMRARKDDIDVSALCEQFGGGGHKKAAGFTIPGKIIAKETWSIH